MTWQWASRSLAGTQRVARDRRLISHEQPSWLHEVVVCHPLMADPNSSQVGVPFVVTEEGDHTAAFIPFVDSIRLVTLIVTHCLVSTIRSIYVCQSVLNLVPNLLDA